jgi:hypothetical protein
MFHPLWLCYYGICLYQLYRWGERKCSFLFLFIWASAFKVPNTDKCCVCSTRHEDDCDNFQQKFQPMMQFGPQIFFCHFSRSLSHAEPLLHLLTLMGNHCADHCQHSCVQHGVFMPGIHQRFFCCPVTHRTVAATWLMSLPVIHSYIVQVQTFSTTLWLHAQWRNKRLLLRL